MFQKWVLSKKRSHLLAGLMLKMVSLTFINCTWYLDIHVWWLFFVILSFQISPWWSWCALVLVLSSWLPSVWLSSSSSWEGGILLLLPPCCLMLITGRVSMNHFHPWHMTVDITGALWKAGTRLDIQIHNALAVVHSHHILPRPQITGHTSPRCSLLHRGPHVRKALQTTLYWINNSVKCSDFILYVLLCIYTFKYMYSPYSFLPRAQIAGHTS